MNNVNDGVWLTFDDGPNVLHTPDLLDCLDKADVKATFFICGQFAQEHSNIVIETFERGHEIANHTWSHPDLKTLSDKGIIKEISRTNEILKSITGITPKRFRAPYSSIDDRIYKIIQKLELEHIDWTKMAIDWQQCTPKEIVNYIFKEGIRDDDIIILHDGCADSIHLNSKKIHTCRRSTIIATELILEKLVDQKIPIFNPLK